MASLGGKAACGCPICGKPMTRAAGDASDAAAAVPATGAGAKAGAGAGAKAAPDPFPFCSTRCQLVDLGRWLGGEYRIPDRETVVWPPGDGSDGGDGGEGDGDRG